MKPNKSPIENQKIGFLPLFLAHIKQIDPNVNPPKRPSNNCKLGDSMIFPSQVTMTLYQKLRYIQSEASTGEL